MVLDVVLWMSASQRGYARPLATIIAYPLYIDTVVTAYRADVDGGRRGVDVGTLDVGLWMLGFGC